MTALTASMAWLAPAAAQPETQANVIAVQIRKQGYSCDGELSAEREQRASAPNAAVWILRCKNATYRVRLTPDMAAQVERIE
jgi:hypothetical protein